MTQDPKIILATLETEFYKLIAKLQRKDKAIDEYPEPEKPEYIKIDTKGWWNTPLPGENATIAEDPDDELVPDGSEISEALKNPPECKLENYLSDEDKVIYLKLVESAKAMQAEAEKKEVDKAGSSPIQNICKIEPKKKVLHSNAMLQKIKKLFLQRLSYKLRRAEIKSENERRREEYKLKKLEIKSIVLPESELRRGEVKAVEQAIELLENIKKVYGV